MPPRASSVHLTLSIDEENVVSPVTVTWTLPEGTSSTEVDVQKLQSENEQLRGQSESTRWG